MSTFYNVRKSLIQAFRILFAAMLFVVAIGTVCPDIARAENLPESTQINEFAQSDEARTQTLALMEAVQNDGSPEASTQIAIGYADKVHYLRFDILPRMNAGESRISRFGFLFDTTKQEGRGR